jgi:glycosyltransferase involved in cell wall biosynthesis
VRIVAIIPAYNEQAALGDVLAELRELPRDGFVLDIVVVDDGSTDRTSAVAQAGGARVLRLCRNLGIGGAVQAGLRLAHRERYDAAVQVDGDGQHPPRELANLLRRPADLVIGTRYRDHGGFRSTPLRRAGSWWLRVVLRSVGVRVSDPTSGFRVYGKRALRLFDFTYPYDFPEPESLAVARAAGLTIDEVPVTMRERRGGRSSIATFDSIYYMVKVTVAVLLAYARAHGRVPKEPVDAD